jgi:hypothetical protein
VRCLQWVAMGVGWWVEFDVVRIIVINQSRLREVGSASARETNMRLAGVPPLHHVRTARPATAQELMGGRGCETYYCHPACTQFVHQFASDSVVEILQHFLASNHQCPTAVEGVGGRCTLHG